MAFSSKKQKYAVFYRRLGQRIFLMDLFELPEEEKLLEKYREQVRKDFGCKPKEGKKR
jgi:hypothetical protein